MMSTNIAVVVVQVTGALCRAMGDAMLSGVGRASVFVPIHEIEVCWIQHLKSDDHCDLTEASCVRDKLWD